MAHRLKVVADQEGFEIIANREGLIDLADVCMRSTNVVVVAVCREGLRTALCNLREAGNRLRERFPQHSTSSHVVSLGGILEAMLCPLFPSQNPNKGEQVGIPDSHSDRLAAALTRPRDQDR